MGFEPLTIDHRVKWSATLPTALNLIMFLTSSGSADESEVVELGHLVLHDGRAVPQLGAVVLVVAGAERDDGAVVDVAQRDHLERHRKRLVRAPVGRQLRAQERRRTGPDKFACNGKDQDFNFVMNQLY